jgi:iron complex outermembrane receptor protein
MRHSVHLALFVAMLTAIPLHAAQGPPAASGQLVIVVADVTGARVASATVRVTRGRTVRNGVAGPDGTLRLDNLEPGDWTLTVTREGFDQWSRRVMVSPGIVEVPVTLRVAGISETVEVLSEGAVIQDAIRLNAPATGGTRLDIPVRDLPVSLSLITRPVIEERGARTGMEASEIAVGVVAGIGVGSIPGYAMRGFSGNQVSLMRDGIRQNTVSQSSRPIDTFLLDRVEILKGPASVMYGEGAVGGAINIVSKSPQPRLGFEGLVSYGSFGTTQLGLGLTGPIGRKITARVDGSLTTTDGYADRSDQKLQALAGSLRWTPRSDVLISAVTTISFDSTSSYYGTPLINGAIDRRTRYLNYNMRDNLARSANSWNRLDADVYLSPTWSLRNELFVATHALDWRNLEGYAYSPATNTVNLSSYFLIYRDDLLTGDRFQARGNFNVAGRPVRLTSGFELQRNDLLRGGLSDPTVRFSVDPFNPAPIFDPRKPYIIDRDVLVGTAAGFTEGMIEVAPSLKVIAGLRGERISLNYVVPEGGGASGNAPGTSGEQTYNAVTGRSGFVWSATERINLYGSFSRALEPTTQLVFLSAEQQFFSMSPGKQWEVGAKATAFANRLDATVAWFDIEKSDILTTSIVNGQLFPQQIGRQVAHGVEVSVSTRPARGLTITGDLALTDASFADFTEQAGGVNFSRDGNVPPNVPEQVWSLWASQQIGPFAASATVRHVGTLLGDNANAVRIGDFTTLDAGLAYRLPRGSRITVRGRNLTDKLYAIRSVSGGSAFRLEAPRSFDVTMSIRY